MIVSGLKSESIGGSGAIFNDITKVKNIGDKAMEPEYDLCKMKRRPNPFAKQLKKQVTISLDIDVIEYFEMMASGSTFLEISRSTFRKIKIMKPNILVTTEFERLIKPLFEQIMILGQQNAQLRQIRDRLLPRLISGKLQVKEQKVSGRPSTPLRVTDQ